MKRGRRKDVVSSFTIIKGAMIEETYAIFAGWDLTQSKRQNVDRLRAENVIGADSATWLRDVAWTFNRRFEPNDRDRALVLLAQHGCDLETWKPLMLWHMTRDEFLVRDFLLHWLFPAYDTGTFRVHANDVISFLRGIGARGAKRERAWSEKTIQRVAAGLLKLAVDFGLLRGSVVKEFASYQLPEAAFVYLLHAMLEDAGAPAKVISSLEWRMFLMRASDVEHELLRLHQYRKLDYQVAGSLVQLTLPCATPREYAERMVA